MNEQSFSISDEILDEAWSTEPIDSVDRCSSQIPEAALTISSAAIAAAKLQIPIDPAKPLKENAGAMAYNLATLAMVFGVSIIIVAILKAHRNTEQL